MRQLFQEVHLSIVEWQVDILRPSMVCCWQAPTAAGKKAKRKGHSMRYATLKPMPQRPKANSQLPQETAEDTAASSHAALPVAGQQSRCTLQVLAIQASPPPPHGPPPLLPPPPAPARRSDSESDVRGSHVSHSHESAVCEVNTWAHQDLTACRAVCSG